MAPILRIGVWSDYVCPFCYLGMPVLERLRREREGQVAVAWRAFELRPEPVPTLDPDGEYLHRIWNASVYPMARERGMTLRLPPVQPRSRNIGDAAVLQEVGSSVGLDPERLGEALAERRHTAGVLADGRTAAEIGVTGVPAMLLSRSEAGGRAYLLSGAVPYAALAEAVERVLSEPGG